MQIMSIDLVWWSPVEHATTVPAGIWAVQSRETIRIDGTNPRGRGQEDVKDSEQGGCFRVQQGQVQRLTVERDAQSVRGERGKIQDQGEGRECDETSRQR